MCLSAEEWYWYRKLLCSQKSEPNSTFCTTVSFCHSSNAFLFTNPTEVYLLACPNGTYHDGGVPGDVTMCTPCPDVNHMTLGPATGPRDCVCKRGFVANGPSCESEKSFQIF